MKSVKKSLMFVRDTTHTLNNPIWDIVWGPVFRPTVEVFMHIYNEIVPGQDDEHP